VTKACIFTVQGKSYTFLRGKLVIDSSNLGPLALFSIPLSLHSNRSSKSVSAFKITGWLRVSHFLVFKAENGSG